MAATSASAIASSWSCSVSAAKALSSHSAPAELSLLDARAVPSQNERGSLSEALASKEEAEPRDEEAAASEEEHISYGKEQLCPLNPS
eukprot:CAMPEP_0183358460 /NCGR_PEP_ID=MMETSP0164_2-20130417/49334_1 /TAXON_ID=221442 /ORGANISM="Coccolithus pelagicus ssp braarudi, Strain PLY182g" /LENGTH=87 /DNA_ID=CAMNT_0025532361 /DNA_START=530 /DNA_END=789 /DNA_ORIENTATION=-